MRKNFNNPVDKELYKLLTSLNYDQFQRLVFVIEYANANKNYELFMDKSHRTQWLSFFSEVVSYLCTLSDLIDKHFNFKEFLQIQSTAIISNVKDETKPFLKENGLFVNADYAQFGGNVHIIYDVMIPFFNIKRKTLFLLQVIVQALKYKHT